MSKTLKVYDPAMCCSTGVCGPTVDDKLVKLASDLSFLKAQGIEVERFNLGHQPDAFANSPLVLEAMGAEAENLPLFIVDGEIKAKATYPCRSELASWFGLDAGVAEGKPRMELRLIQTDRCC